MLKRMLYVMEDYKDWIDLLVAIVGVYLVVRADNDPLIVLGCLMVWGTLAKVGE